MPESARGMRGADVIVIGAGAAGLAAAADLSAAGLDVVILEARSRPGGRIHTERAAGWPVPIELGAEFIHGEPPEAWELAQNSRALIEEIPDAHWSAGPSGFRRVRDFWGQMERITAMIPRRGPDVSFREFLRKRRGVTGPQRRLALQFVSGFHAGEIGRISARSLSTRGERPSDAADKRQHRLLSGQDGLVKALWAGARRARVRLRLRSPVTEVRWRSGRVAVSTRRSRRQKELEARAAVITVPLGVLKRRAEMAGAIRFVPEITAKRPALERMEMGHVFRIVLRFREAFWEEPGFLEQRLAPGAADEDARFAFLHDPRGSFPTWWTALPSRVAMLTGWAGGDAALRFLGRPAADVAAEALRSLGKTLNVRSAWLEKRLLHAHFHDWNSDPFARGAYSYALVGGAGAAQRLSRPVASTLFFAGEATDTEQTGTVSGAIASGRRAAGQVLRSR